MPPEVLDQAPHAPSRSSPVHTWVDDGLGGHWPPPLEDSPADRPAEAPAHEDREVIAGRYTVVARDENLGLVFIEEEGAWMDPADLMPQKARDADPRDGAAAEAADRLLALRSDPLVRGGVGTAGPAVWTDIDFAGEERVIDVLVRRKVADGMSEHKARKRAERMLAVQRYHRRMFEQAQEQYVAGVCAFELFPKPGALARAWRLGPRVPGLEQEWRTRLRASQEYWGKRNGRSVQAVDRRPSRLGRALVPRRVGRITTGRRQAAGTRRATTRATARGPDDGPGEGEPPPSGGRPHPDGEYGGLTLLGALGALVEPCGRVEMVPLRAFFAAILRRPRPVTS